MADEMNDRLHRLAQVLDGVDLPEAIATVGTLASAILAQLVRGFGKDPDEEAAFYAGMVRSGLHALLEQGQAGPSGIRAMHPRVAAELLAGQTVLDRTAPEAVRVREARVRRVLDMPQGTSGTFRDHQGRDVVVTHEVGPVAGLYRVAGLPHELTALQLLGLLEGAS